MAKYTQKAIMDTFLALLEEKTLDKITVRDIVEKCEINRNTFYYYYRDIYELLEEVFRVETENFRKDLSPDMTFLDEYAFVSKFIRALPTGHSNRQFFKCMHISHTK